LWPRSPANIRIVNSKQPIGLQRGRGRKKFLIYIAVKDGAKRSRTNTEGSKEDLTRAEKPPMNSEGCRKRIHSLNMI
jgi:hypothetical protein